MGKFYITTTIYYVNAPPHIGHAFTDIQADVLARYHRVQGDDVFFLTGTDEHGAKIAQAALVAKKDPQDFADEISIRFQELKNILDLSSDDFIRTTDKARHWPGAQLIWQKLAASGDIYKKKYRGLYCLGHEAFVTQKDLVDGKCRDHLTEPKVVEEENYFFRLSKYAKEIESKIESDGLQIVPEARKNEILSFIKNEGLEDVSFSRPRKDLSWGIPVPRDDSETMYVWCDALTNYLSAIGYGRNEDYKKWWPPDVQVIGKDILRFHAAIWPAMLLSAGLPLPKHIFAHGFITVEGQKMSKTIGNIVDPFALVEKYGTDAVRYYLLREIPSGGDGDFSEQRFKEVYNADLANGLGNLVSRVMKMAASHDIHADFKNEKNLEIGNLLDQFEIKKAMDFIWSKVAESDTFVQQKEPFRKIKTDPENAKQDMLVLLKNLFRIGIMLQPFMPATSEKILETLKNNSEIKTPLFPRIS